jgi:hypothetical protein
MHQAACVRCSVSTVITPRARDTQAHWPVSGGQKDVAMIDLALDADNVDGRPAFAAPSVAHHLMAGIVEHIQHRAVHSES